MSLTWRFARPCRAASCLLLGASVLTLAACGSSSSPGPNTEATAVASLATAIQHYNSARQTDLSSTAAACRSAENDVGNASDLANSTSSAQVNQALKKAYGLAVSGFKDCADAAPQLDYPLMARAESEIDQANAWLAKAKALAGA